MNSSAPRWVALACGVFLGCDGGSSVTRPSATDAPTAPPAEIVTAAVSLTAPSASAVAVDPSLSRRGIRWALNCTPAKLTMATRNKLSVEVVAINESKETLDTLRHHMSLTSDAGGRPGRFFANGHHEKKWSALPPGETVNESYMLGENLLPKAGDVTIAVDSDGARATCAVHVDP